MYKGNPEIIACTLGTRGDILPFLALCASFVARGHQVTILTNRNWKDLVLGVGADFHEIADEDIPQSARDDKAFYHTNTFPSFSRSYSFIQQRVLANPRCVVIYRFNMLGAECAAEKFNVPAVKVALQPSVMRSVERPPWPLTRLAQGRLGGLLKKTVIPTIYRFGEVAAEYREHTNRFRNSVGLRKLPFGAASEVEDLFLVLCPDWFAMPQKDWPARSRTTGFLYFDQEYHDQQLENFISANGAPVVFTPGTGVSDIGEFFSRAEALCHELQLPGVFLSRALRDSGKQWSNRIAVRDHAELHWLLPLSCMLVHHGGIGTTAQAIRAGIPQIVLPDRFDQPDNALRVAILGLGGAVFSRRPAASDVADIMLRVLASGTVRAQVQRGAALVRGSSSTDLACQMIDGIVAQHYGHGGRGICASPRTAPGAPNGEAACPV